MVNIKNDFSRYSSYRESHMTKNGSWYHDSFKNDFLLSFSWQIEQYVLSIIMENYKYKPTHLDFACGSGRIISFLKNKTVDPIGVDLSPSMLEAAIKNNPELNFITGDITKISILGDRKFSLITAFRFFPNAEPDLRNEVLNKLHTHLEDDGLLVINNHQNKHVWKKIKELLSKKKQPYEVYLSTKSIELMLKENGFCVIDRYNVRILPIELLLPTYEELLNRRSLLLMKIERFFIKRKVFFAFARIVIFICKKTY